LLARAANLDNYYVRGVQLHGLAQRGGTIPTFVRFGKENEVYSPAIMQTDADLILAFEPLEAIRATYYASKKKTTFVINDSPYMPIYGNLMKLSYPTKKEVLKRISPFSRDVFMFKASEMGEKQFGKTLFGNIIILGFAVGHGLLPLSKEAIRKASKATVPRSVDLNLKAFESGIKYGKGIEKIID